MQQHLHRNRAIYSGSGGGIGLVAKSCPTLRPHGLPARLLCPWDSPGKNPGVGCHSLLQGIFPTQELNPGLLHCRQILYQLSYVVNGDTSWEAEVSGQDPQHEWYLC